MDFDEPDALILQVSDLHFGREIHPPVSRQGAINSRPGVAIPGMHPHEIAACRELENTARTLALRYSRSAKILIVAGDLTVMGDDSEFALALTYLKGRVSTSFRMSLGLGGVFDTSEMVPGNHDHWGGRHRSAIVNSGSPGVHGAYFATTPSHPWFFGTHRLGRSNGIQLQLMGMDSCAGAGPNIVAQGTLPIHAFSHLERDINDANARAQQEHRKVVRLLTIHHSPNPGNGPRAWAHALDRQSQQALVSFATNKQVHCILTGHMHTSRLPASPGAPHGEECRSGTATQYGSKTNEVLAHRITLESGQVLMRSVPLVRTGGGPFTPASPPVQRWLQ